MNLWQSIHPKQHPAAPAAEVENKLMDATPVPVMTMAGTITPALTPATPGGGPPPPTHGFKNFMNHLGHDFIGVFAFLGSQKGQQAIAAVEGTAVVIATAFNPAAGAALAGVEALVNAGLKQVVSIESVAAAAGAADGTGTQKAAAVTSVMTPQIAAFLQSIGISEPKADQVQSLGTAISSALVAILNAIPAPTTPAA